MYIRYERYVNFTGESTRIETNQRIDDKRDTWRQIRFVTCINRSSSNYPTLMTKSINVFAQT